MTGVKKGPQGQVTLPTELRMRPGWTVGDTLPDIDADGAIGLRPAAKWPIETYSDARIREFETATQVDEPMRDAVARRVAASAS